MPCRGTGHHFSALECGQATKIVMRRGGGAELCVGEVSGVENRQVVSPPVRTNVWLGRSPHPIRQGSAAQGSHRASVQPSESPYSHPAGAGPARAPRHWRGDPHSYLAGGPTRQGQSRRAPIGQRSVEQVCRVSASIPARAPAGWQMKTWTILGSGL